MMNEPILLPYTIWKFKSTNNNDSFISARRSEPGEQNYEHGYQCILGHVDAYTAQDALKKWGIDI